MEVAATASPALSSLYVGDLHSDVTDDLLHDAFSQFDSLNSVRVCRDSTTGRPLCYGYVNFTSPQDAIDAIAEKNHCHLNGKMIRVMHLHRDSDARKSGIGNVFVKNLSDSISNAGLEEIFKSFGAVISCKVSMTDDGKSRRYGFVQFESEDSAIAAIDKLHGLTIDGKQIYVGKFIKRSDRLVANNDTKYTNLYMKNLDPEIGDELLHKKFSEFGKISSLAIAKDEMGIPKGFGFVNFDSYEDARRAVEEMNGSQVGSKVLYVARAQKKIEREEMLRREFEERRKDLLERCKGLNVYVKNINDDVTDEELKEHFGECGTVTSAKIMRNGKGISRGFGFICFSSEEEANKAVTTLSGRMFHGKPLYVAIAQRKEERQSQLQIHFTQRMPGLVPAAYPPFFFTAPPGAVPVPTLPQRPVLIDQPLALGPGWRATSFASPIRPPGFQLPAPLIANPPRQARHSRGRLNEQFLSLNNPHSGLYKQYFHRPNLSVYHSYDSGNHQAGQSKYVPKLRTRELDGSDKASFGSESSQILSMELSAASPEQQKQILGERLCPLVEKYKPELAEKITEMLLELDSSELLHLLDSPDSLAAKVEEAVQALSISNGDVSSPDSLRSSFFSAEVAVS